MIRRTAPRRIFTQGKERGVLVRRRPTVQVAASVTSSLLVWHFEQPPAGGSAEHGFRNHSAQVGIFPSARLRDTGGRDRSGPDLC